MNNTGHLEFIGFYMRANKKYLPCFQGDAPPKVSGLGPKLTIFNVIERWSRAMVE